MPLSSASCAREWGSRFKGSRALPLKSLKADEKVRSSLPSLGVSSGCRARNTREMERHVVASHFVECKEFLLVYTTAGMQPAQS